MALPALLRSSNLPTLHDVSVQELDSSESSLRRPPVSRKRRRSDAEVTPVPKRPRSVPYGPRQQTVSDPFPIVTTIPDTSQFEHWFKDYFEIPERVATDGLDIHTPVDVDLFRDWTVVNLPRVDLSLNPCTWKLPQYSLYQC